MAVLTRYRQERIRLHRDRRGRNNLHRTTTTTTVRCTGTDSSPSGRYRYHSRRRRRIASFVCWRWPCMSSKLLPPTLATFAERNDILLLTIWHGTVCKLAFEISEKKLLIKMATCKQERRVLVFRPTAHAYCCHVMFQTNHCLKFGGRVRADMIFRAHCNRTMPETAEGFRKLVAPWCSAKVELSAHMRFVNNGSQWRSLHTLEHRRFFYKRSCIPHKQRK